MPDILVFGASHVGVRLAERLVSLGHHVRVIDPAPASASMSWTHESSDYVVPSDVGRAKIVYVVTDEDERNIRVALAVRGKSADVPIVMALTQSRLGEKLARHLSAFAFINPPALAAERFVEALMAAPPGSAPGDVQKTTATSEDAAARWQPDPLVLRAVLVIGAIGVLATTYFHLAERLRWVDALYFVVTMMATVGFGDISLRESSTMSKLVGITVMIASLANTAVIFALITDSLLKKRLVLSFGRRRIRDSGHVVVAGIASVGWNVVELLRARGESIVVVDNHEQGRYLPGVYARRLPAIIGDARQERTLRDAGLLRAKALLCVTNSDLANLEIGLNAKLLRPDMPVILRIFDQELAQSLRERLEMPMVYSMSSIAAEVLVGYSERPPR